MSISNHLENEDELFSENFILDVIGWGENITDTNGNTTFENKMDSLNLNFKYWYSKFKSKRLLAIAMLAIQRSTSDLVFPLDLSYRIKHKDLIKAYLVKSIIFEIETMKKTGEYDSIKAPHVH